MAKDQSVELARVKMREDNDLAFDKYTASAKRRDISWHTCVNLLRQEYKRNHLNAMKRGLAND